MITGPAYHRTRLKFIQLSKVNEDQILAVIVAEGNLVKNQMIDLEEPIDGEQILKLNLLLNTQSVSYTHLDVYKRQVRICP